MRRTGVLPHTKVSFRAAQHSAVADGACGEVAVAYAVAAVADAVADAAAAAAVVVVVVAAAAGGGRGGAAACVVVAAVVVAAVVAYAVAVAPGVVAVAFLRLQN